MGTQGEIVPEGVVETSVPLQTTQRKTYHSSFKDRESKEIPVEKPFLVTADKALFHIKPIIDRAWNPTQVYLEFSAKIELQSSSNLYPLVRPDKAGGTDPQHPDITGHARFMNPMAVHFIKNTEVMPNRNNDIQSMDDKQTCAIEWMRWFTQNKKLEQKHSEMKTDQGGYYHLAMSSNPSQIGKYAWKRNPDDKADVDALFMETTALTYNTYRMKLPGPFFESSTYLPGMLEFLIKVSFSKPENCIVQQFSSEDGKLTALNGATQAGGVGGSYYVFDVESVKLVVEYVELKDVDKENFKNTFYSLKNVTMECYHTFRVQASIPFPPTGQGYKIIRQDLNALQGMIPEKFFFAFIRANLWDPESVKFGCDYIDRFRFEPHNVKTIQFRLNGKALFKDGPLPFTNTVENAMRLHRYLSDSTAAPFEYETRMNPFAKDFRSLHAAGRWIGYVDIDNNRGTTFADVTKRINGELEVEIQFEQVLVDPQPIVFVMFFTNMPLNQLNDGIANTWNVTTSFATPIVVPDANIKAIRSGTD